MMAEGEVGFHDHVLRILGKKQVNSGKSAGVKASRLRQPLKQLKCPQCSSGRLYKDGMRYLSSNESVQRWLCRNCGYRFSEKPPQKNQEWSINTQTNLTSSRRICAIQKEAKNLDSATEIKTVAGDTPIKRMKNSGTQSNLLVISVEARGLITEYMAYLEREGFSNETQYPTTLSHLVKDGANLLDPENVKEIIAKQKKENGENWSNSMKMLAVYAYDSFVQMKGITWERPNYHQDEATIYVPDEKDLDLLISAAPRKKLATFLGALKETFADPSEIIYADWKDLQGNVLSINHPVKGHLPGQVELTPQLTAMINALPRKGKRIFASNYKSLYASFMILRKRAADKYQKPELRQITFKSYRHWGGSYVAQASNGNPLIIMRVLRHKSFASSLRYIHTIAFKNEDYEVTSATTAEEILALGKVGWQKYDEATIKGIIMHFYRKPKRFGSVKKLDDKL